MPGETTAWRDPTWRRSFRLYMGASLLLMLVAAALSDGIYHADEYFQIDEFASHKLGITPAQDLPWEFDAQVRPWLQPAFFYAIAVPLRALGMEDAFSLMFVFRLTSGLVGWLSLLAFTLMATNWLGPEIDRRLLPAVTAFLCFVPYLLVRTSSESLSAAFLMLGYALLSRGAPIAGVLPVTRPRIAWTFWAGLFLGLSFECRFQMALPILGLGLWVSIVGRVNWRTLSSLFAGLLLSFIAGLVVDAWGYGSWVLVPWNYLRVNLIEGRAATFGVLPAYAYLYLIPALLPPIGLVVTVALLVFWWRRPAHSLTWVTLPLVLAHSLIGHKEERFLFPLYGFCPTILLMAFAPGPAKLARLADFFWRRRKSWIARALIAVNLVFLVGLSVLPVRVPMKTAQYIYRSFPDQFEVYGVGRYDPVSIWRGRLTFAAPPRYHHHSVEDLGALEAVWHRSRAPIYFASRLPLTADDMARFRGNVQLVYSYNPLWLSRLDFKWVSRLDWGCLYRIDPPEKSSDD